MHTAKGLQKPINAVASSKLWQACHQTMLPGPAGHHPGTPLMDVLAVQAQATIAKFVPQNISNVLIAYVKLEEDCPPALVDALVAAAQRHLHNFSPQVVSGSAGGPL